jgi:HPt (histidine-containing phosphotransfer) domain-containing protein
MAPVGKDGFSAALDLQLLWAYQLAAELETNLGMKEYAKQYETAAAQLKKPFKKNIGTIQKIICRH